MRGYLSALCCNEQLSLELNGNLGHLARFLHSKFDLFVNFNKNAHKLKMNTTLSVNAAGLIRFLED